MRGTFHKCRVADFFHHCPLHSFFTIPCDAFFLDDDPVSFFTIWDSSGSVEKMLPALLTGLIIGFATEYLFTEVFIVDLPTWSE